MAKLNFPDHTLVQTYTEAGITWTWNDKLEVWSAEPGNGFDEAVADGRYLSKLTNDTAAGEITFQQNIIVDNRIGVGIESPERSLDVDGAVKLGSPDGTGIIILGRNEVTPEDNWHIGASDGKFEIWSGLLGSGDSKFTVEDDQINSRKLFIAEEDVNVLGDIVTGGFYRNKTPLNPNNSITVVNAVPTHAGQDVTDTVTFVAGKAQSVTGARLTTTAYQVDSAMALTIQTGHVKHTVLNPICQVLLMEKPLTSTPQTTHRTTSEVILE